MQYTQYGSVPQYNYWTGLLTKIITQRFEQGKINTGKWSWVHKGKMPFGVSPESHFTQPCAVVDLFTAGADGDTALSRNTNSIAGYAIEDAIARPDAFSTVYDGAFGKQVAIEISKIASTGALVSEYALDDYISSQLRQAEAGLSKAWIDSLVSYIGGKFTATNSREVGDTVTQYTVSTYESLDGDVITPPSSANEERSFKEFAGSIIQKAYQMAEDATDFTGCGAITYVEPSDIVMIVPSAVESNLRTWLYSDAYNKSEVGSPFEVIVSDKLPQFEVSAAAGETPAVMANVAAMICSKRWLNYVEQGRITSKITRPATEAVYMSEAGRFGVSAFEPCVILLNDED